MFDYMFSSDIFVRDMRAQADLLVRGLRLHPPSPRAVVTDSPEAHATMLRIRRDFALAPTRLEVIQPARPEGHWNCVHIQQAWRAQRARPVRFHNVVLVGDLDALAQRLQQRRVPHVLDATLAFRRLWVGIDAQRIDTYDPAFDAGLRIEVLSFDDFPVQSPPAGVAPAQPLDRVLARSFLVPDLEAAMRTLDATFGWQTEVPTAPDADAGVLRAVYGFRHPLSARLELLQVLRPDSAAGVFLQRHGPGPYALVLAATGWREWSAALAEAGVPAHACARAGAPPAPCIAVEPGPLGDLRVELAFEDE